MTKQERLFSAMSGADAALLARSEQAESPRLLPMGLVAAACLILALGGYLRLHSPIERPPSPDDPPPAESPETDIPVQTLHLSGGDIGTFYLHQLCYDTSSQCSDFILYVDQKNYCQVTENGVCTIEPLANMGDLPTCSLEISRQPDISLEDAAALAAETLAETYATVSDPQDAAITEGLLVTGSNGTAWDAEQAEVYLVDDRQGGVFILMSRYFLEAAEGHGARFSDMISTFEVVTPGEAVPPWLSELRAAGDRLIPALFAGDLSSVADLLAEDAIMDISLEEGRSVSSIDYTTDSDRNPTRAVISVQNRQLEDSYDYLTIELVYQEGRWLAAWAGLEK